VTALRDAEKAARADLAKMSEAEAAALATEIAQRLDLSDWARSCRTSSRSCSTCSATGSPSRTIRSGSSASASTR
jgi:hypothetical protein